MLEKVQVFAPASVANVGPGYDTFGFAIETLGEIITLTKRKDRKLNILATEGAVLPSEPKNNVATVAIQSLLDHLGSDQGMDVHIKKLFKPGSGLGSSASSASGAAFAANILLGRPLKTPELLVHALEGEKIASGSIHADNVAPSLLGGFQTVRSYEPLDVFSVPTPENLHVLIIFPDVQVKTSMAKSLIPREMNLRDAREQWGNVGALVHAMHTGDYELMGRAITDRIAEPYRKQLIPQYDEVKEEAMQLGSAGFNISGSGPSMFALFKDGQTATVCEKYVKKIYERTNLKVMMHLSKVNPHGCQVI